MSAFAQKANDTTGIFFINARGGIYNHAGTKLGYIGKYSVVRDNTGKELYLIDKDGNFIGAGGENQVWSKRIDHIIYMAKTF